MTQPQFDVKNRRILVVCNVDAMAVCLLDPWLGSLRESGYEVHVACTPGEHWTRLQGRGYRIHPIHLRRSFNPFANIRAFIELYHLLKGTTFGLVNVHSPIAAAVARVAALLAGVEHVIYTVHGFYFHGSSPMLLRWPLIQVEKWLARRTIGFMFVSDEDRRTALQLGITKTAKIASTIYNGVDLDRFFPAETKENARIHLGLPGSCRIVGIVARIAKEKGYREFLDMAAEVCGRHPDVRFLVVGDSLRSDRDQFGSEFSSLVRRAGLEGQFVVTGFTDRVPEYLRAMDIFVLPSYREGFPVSILEAMATGLPVVTTDVRGCREAVRHGQTGLIVPPRDASTLTQAVLALLNDGSLARAMGAAGRQRACELYNQKAAQLRFVSVIDSFFNPPGESASPKSKTTISLPMPDAVSREAESKVSLITGSSTVA